MQKPFPELTPLGQVRRLRGMARKALAAYTLEVTHLRLLSNEFNCIFQVDTRKQGRYVLRISLPEGGHDPRTALAEAAWLDALGKETDLSVPAPRHTRKGDLVVEVTHPGVPEPRMCALFHWVPGTDLARHLTLENITRWGALLAELHTHAQGFTLPEGAWVPTYDNVFYFQGESCVLESPEYSEFFPPERLQIYLQGITWADAMAAKLAVSGQPQHILHGDLHQWNVRHLRGQLSPIDFEDLVFGWPIQDIAITLYYLIHREDYPQLAAAFQEGYTARQPWPAQIPGDLDAFIAARAINLVNLVIQSPHPNYQQFTSTFVTEKEALIRRLLSKHGHI